MRHIKDPKFQPLFDPLPVDGRAAADKNFALLKSAPNHPHLHFNRLRYNIGLARVCHEYRLLAVERDDRFQWFWIGAHAAYARLMR